MHLRTQKRLGAQPAKWILTRGEGKGLCGRIYREMAALSNHSAGACLSGLLLNGGKDREAKFRIVLGVVLSCLCIMLITTAN